MSGVNPDIQPLPATIGDDVIRGTGDFNWQGTSSHATDGIFVYNHIYNYGDILFGDAGDDLIIGDLYDNDGFIDYSSDQINGGDGNDTIYADTGPENPNWNTVTTGGSGTSRGGAGDDFLYGGGIADNLYGDADNDTLYGFFGGDYMYGGAGNDILYGGLGDDSRMQGDDGNDTIYGGDGGDYIYGGRGSDTIYGDLGDDFITGEDNGGTRDSLAKDTLTYIQAAGLVHVDLAITTQQETVNAGVDRIVDIEILVGSNYSDRLFGSALGDTIRGAVGSDALVGRAGNDSMNGQDGNDWLQGDAGDDSMWGGNGNDKFFGGAGKDYMSGGAGKDSYYLNHTPSVANRDTIAGYNVVDDTIYLNKVTFAAVGTAMSADEFHVGTSAGDAEDRIIYNKTAGILYYDADGTGTAKSAVILTYIDKNLALGHGDFLMA